VTVNSLMSGGPTLTGMVPTSYPAELRAWLLSPEVMVPPILWLASERSDGVTGMRFNAAKWRTRLPRPWSSRQLVHSSRAPLVLTTWSVQGKTSR
jgi:hypothetical protein